MREIEAREVTKTVARLLQEACYSLPEDVLVALKQAREIEESPIGREVLDRILENAEIASQGVIDFVVSKVEAAGPNPCPPKIVRVGIGGTVDKTVLMAKKALLRRVGEPSPDSEVAELERGILQRVNNLGIGPMGYGGRTTALAVHIEAFPCHIASLPVAVNLQCHSARHKEASL